MTARNPKLVPPPPPRIGKSVVRDPVDAAAVPAIGDGVEVCLLPGCGRPVKNRGLCNSCNLAAAKLIKAERTTWEQLEEWGMCLPPKPRSKFVAAFEDLASKKRNSKSATNTNGSSDVSEAVQRRAAAPAGASNLEDEPVTPGQARRRIRALLTAAGPMSIDSIVAQTQLDRATVIELLQDDPAFACDDRGRHKIRGT